VVKVNEPALDDGENRSMTNEDNAILDALAHQARIAYATHRLTTCEAAVRRWQRRVEQAAAPIDDEHARHELAYYTQQVMRWRDYLAELMDGDRPAA
jgi:hypothetical protein